jgi:phosphomannomutase
MPTTNPTPIQQIKFGTDGWRAIIADDYTVENVRRVAEATALWLVQNERKRVVIGHDCRFAGELFAATTAQVLGAHGIQIRLAKGFVSTPMVSLGVVKTHADLGVVITASHNPPSYNGFKLKSHFGGPSLPDDIAAVEALIPDVFPAKTLPTLAQLEANGLLEYVDLETMYIDHVFANFDIEAMRNAPFKVGYDAMYGAGQRAMLKILPNAVALHCDYNPGMHGQAPEPIDRNLREFATLIANDADIALGIANDGDADRIGMYDEDGNFVDSHHILLLLLLYMHHYKGLSGKVVITFSVTDKMKLLAEKFGLDYEVTKIGFKYIAEIMTREDVLVGGEESGGLAVKGHIPERDGIWIGLMILEMMAKTNKSLKALIQEVYDYVGSFASDRDDLHLTEEKKQAIIAACKNREYTHFGNYKVQSVEDIDGFKFNLSNTEWVMMRPSGTEPVLRVYAQAPDLAAARAILDATQATIL